jgi:CheY-like chemotaxis protein
VSKKILVVDDSKNTRGILRFMLESRGYTFEEAEDGEDGLAKIRQAPPDLIVLDAMMPRKSGFDTCRELKADPALRAIPVIMLTAIAQSNAAVDWKEAGADRFFAKPFKVADVLEAIEGFLAPAASKPSDLP